MANKEKLQKLLQKLVKSIYVTINEGLARGTLQPLPQQYFRWKLTEFEYDDTGIKKKSAKGEKIFKPFWGIAAGDIFQKVSKLSIYDDVFTTILEGYKLEEFQCRRYLESLIAKVAGDILVGKVKTATDSAKYITSFLKDLNEEEQEYRAEVQFKGLILQSRSIQLDGNVRLRKPIRKDFEKEVLASFPSLVREPLEDPTAFLHIRVYVEKDVKATPSFQADNTLRNEIERGLAVLRLFRVGAVQYLHYTINTDSMSGSGITSLTAGKTIGADKYLITKEDIKPLKIFWSNMKKVALPTSAYAGSQKEPDELSIAYDRYNDSLEAHMLEKRISSAVMGLEALYLSPSEQQEMSYRLRMRVGKLLSLIGYNPNEVRKNLIEAYEIRSRHVHGGILKQKDKKKLEAKFNDLNEFSRRIIDYLRASIVALLRRPSKNSLIQKIDDSFLDSSKEEEIKTMLFIPY